MKVPAIILLSVVLTAEALPSALIQSPMARSDRDKPIDTVGEGLKDPKVAEAVIALAYLEKVAEAAALGAIGAIADAQVQEHGEGDAAHAAAFAKAKDQGRSIESEDRKSTDAENRFLVITLLDCLVKYGFGKCGKYFGNGK